MSIFVGRVGLNTGIRCDRLTALGNPYPLGPSVTRDQSCDAFRHYLWLVVRGGDPAESASIVAQHLGIKSYVKPQVRRDEVLRLLVEIQSAVDSRGFATLLCHCTPLRCHCDTIKRLMEHELTPQLLNSGVWPVQTN
jgi:hypothetical protein